MKWLRRSSLFVALSALIACSSTFVDADGGDAATADGGDGSIGTIEGGPGTDAPPDTAPPPPIRRLIVANSGASITEGVLIWDDAHLLASDRAPDVVLQNPSIAQSIPSIRVAGDRLFVINGNALVGLDGVGTLGASATPVFSIALTGAPGSMHYSSMNDLLFISDRNAQGGGLVMFAGATVLKNGDTMKARFGGMGEPITAVYRDPTSDRVYFADPLQQVIKYTASASTQSGNAMPIIDMGSGVTVTSMASDGTRLYAGGSTLGGAAAVFIYNLSSIHPGSQPDVTLQTGLPQQGSVIGVHVADNVLFVGYQGQSTGTFAFLNALSLSPQSTGVALPSSNGCTSMRYSTKMARLFCAEPSAVNNAVNVWENVKTTPVQVAHVTTKISTPRNIELWEN